MEPAALFERFALRTELRLGDIAFGDNDLGAASWAIKIHRRAGVEVVVVDTCEIFVGYSALFQGLKSLFFTLERFDHFKLLSLWQKGSLRATIPLPCNLSA